MSQVSQEAKDQIRREMLEDDYRETQAMISHQTRMKDDEVYLMEHCGICEVSEAIDNMVEKLNNEGFMYSRKEVLEYLIQE